MSSSRITYDVRKNNPSLYLEVIKVNESQIKGYGVAPHFSIVQILLKKIAF